MSEHQGDTKMTVQAPMLAVRPDPVTGYFSNIDDIRKVEYPLLQDTTYLDHAGTALYARSLVDDISHELKISLFGNPHSDSSSSQLSSKKIDDVRLGVLRFLGADPEHFDLVFVSNATAAIKLVGEAFRDCPSGFWYGYHIDSHTSLTGVREFASLGSQCVGSDAVEEWLSSLDSTEHASEHCMLLGYPGQSNLSGDRPPLEWCARISKLRREKNVPIFSLFDAAALLSTSSIDFTDLQHAPDFTALSFYKIFGLPDLGALVVRKDCSHAFNDRRYFGGGTVDMVISVGDEWVSRKQSAPHRRLEDGTLPFHSIVSLGLALTVHSRIYGSMKAISNHVAFLAENAYERLRALKHSTGVSVCETYGLDEPQFGTKQGPTIAFNLRDAAGGWIGKSEVEKLASVRNIQFRTGGLCNPGGISTHLDLSASQLRENFAEGMRCGDHHDILNGKPTGVIRVSFGAMSSISDVDALISFVEDFFIIPLRTPITPPPTPFLPNAEESCWYIRSLAIFPIKSCAAFRIPPDKRWEVSRKGLAWDREWCLVHQGTGKALSQKVYPQMATIRPAIDLERRVLVVRHCPEAGSSKQIEFDIDSEAGQTTLIEKACAPRTTNAESVVSVCGEKQQVLIFTSSEVAKFFTDALDVPCTLARQQNPSLISSSPTSPTPSSFPAKSLSSSPFVRDQSPPQTINMPGCYPSTATTPPAYPDPANPLDGVQNRNDLSPSSIQHHLANESPILLISQPSVDSVNAAIRLSDPSAPLVPADAFRANIIIAPSPVSLDESAEESEVKTETRKLESGTINAWAEDDWSSLSITPSFHNNSSGVSNESSSSSPSSSSNPILPKRPLAFEVQGPCHRCQMVCVDQTTGLRGKEPYSTLAKVRRREGRVWFGIHLRPDLGRTGEKEEKGEVGIGDCVHVS